MINYLPPALPNYADDVEKLFPEETRKAYEITLQVTEDCCMACSYCYQLNKKPNKMSLDNAKTFIDNLLTDSYTAVNTKNAFAVCLNFIGGEPLMEIDLIDNICEYFIKSLIELNHPWLYHIRFGICSNGLLYKTEKVQNFFKKYNNFCSFTISIDGNKELHDLCRLDLNGKGTYDRAMEAVHLYYNQYGQMPETKMTLAPSNVQYTEQALLNLISEGYERVPFNCVFEPGWTSEHATILYYQLKSLADFIITNDLYNKINIRMFSETSFCPMEESDNQNWCGGVDSKTIAVDYKGDIFPCIRYMESSLNGTQTPLKIGNIVTGYLTSADEQNNYKKITNITRRSQSTDECFYCPIAQGCDWCSAYNYQETGSPNKRVTHICIMHKAKALANVYYWNKLYQYLKIDKVFKNNVPQQWALEIIPEDEYNYLQLISKGE